MTQEDVAPYLKQRLLYYQKHFGLEAWHIELKVLHFEASKHPYRADIEIDSEHFSATIFISSRDNAQDEQALVHELAHLLMWDLDQFCTLYLSTKNRQAYLNVLEQTIKRLSAILKK